MYVWPAGSTLLLLMGFVACVLQGMAPIPVAMVAEVAYLTDGHCFDLQCVVDCLTHGTPLSCVKAAHRCPSCNCQSVTAEADHLAAYALCLHP